MVWKCLEVEVVVALEEKVALVALEEKVVLVAPVGKEELEVDPSGEIALIGGEQMEMRTILRKVVVSEMMETTAVPIITPSTITPQFARARSMWFS